MQFPMANKSLMGTSAIVLLALIGRPEVAHSQAACDAEVYWDAGFKGESWHVTGDQEFVGNHWNDRISSIRVRSGNWEFFWDAGYRGEVLRLRPGDYDFVGPHWNDQISSMRCVSGNVDNGYVLEGVRYDWYDDGWNGAGYYIVGSEHERGRGFGGGEGTHGWHHEGSHGGRDGHGGSGHSGGGHGGGGHAGGNSGGGHGGGGHGGGGHGGGHGGGGRGGHGGGSHGGAGHGGGGHGGGHGGGGHPHKH